MGRYRFYQVGHFPGQGRLRSGTIGFAMTFVAMSAVTLALQAHSLLVWRGVRTFSANRIQPLAKHQLRRLPRWIYLADLVSYSHKHNMRNGEQGRDGTDANWSWNCGEEGETDDQAVWLYVGVRCVICWHLLCCRVAHRCCWRVTSLDAQRGNNAYCQDNELSWLIGTKVMSKPRCFVFP